MANGRKMAVKYTRVAEELQARIAGGVYTEALPGVKQLAKEFDVNFMTVDKAIRKLEELGAVYRIPRKGTYVKRLRNIAFCYEGDATGGLLDSVFSPMYLAAQRFLSRQGCPMFVESRMSLQNSTMGILANRIDGMIFSHRVPESVSHLDSARMPLVRVLAELDDLPYDHVTYDNASVGTVAAQWLLDHGHRHVAYVGDQLPARFVERFRTFAHMIEAGGAKTVYSPYEAGTWEPRCENIRRQMDDVFGRDVRPTAIFCPSDNEISMIYDCLYRFGLKPMQDIVVVSCNYDRRLLEFCDPPPVSVDIHLEGIGRLAAKRLLERIETPDLPKREDILEPEIVLANSALTPTTARS
jgi:LacI family transcriptional regulator